MSRLDEITRWCEARAPGETLARVELDRLGQSLFEVAGPSDSTWYRWSGGAPERLRPEADRDLPLAAAVWARKGVRLVAYRPGRRIVFSSKEGDTRSIIKGYRRGRSEATAERYASLRSLDLGGFRLPHLLRVDESLECLVFEHLAGVPLEIRRSSAESFYQIGRNLRELQDVAFLPDLPRFDALDELGVLDRWADRVRILCGAMPEDWGVVRGRVESALRALIGQNFVVCHRDLHDGQLIDLGDAVGLVDFDLICRADATLDAANLLAHLNLRVLQGAGSASEAGAQACGEALLEGLDRFTEIGFWPRLRVFEATSLLRLALVYSLRPRWRRVVPSLIDVATRCLKELEVLA